MAKLLGVLVAVAAIGACADDYHSGIHELRTHEQWADGVELACLDKASSPLTGNDQPPCDAVDVDGSLLDDGVACDDGTFIYNGKVRGCCDFGNTGSSLWFYECIEQ